MIWLIGNKGMLGTELSRVLDARGMAYVGTDREVDVTSEETVRAFAREVDGKGKLDFIVNCAAYTAVDKAEDDRELCERLNARAPGILAQVAKEIGTSFLHISTDYVFNGDGNRPYREDDDTDPTGYYGLTKRDGERAALSANPNTYIVRTSWLYGQYGNNFVKTMLRLMNEKESIRVVNDQRGTPTWAFDLAEAVAGILSAKRPVPYGIYHFSNNGNITWFDFAREIHRLGREKGLLQRDCEVLPCTSAEYPSKVRRPPYSVLDKAKIELALGTSIPVWNESLSKYLDIR